MKAVLLIAALAAACGAPTGSTPAEAPPPPAAENPVEPDKALKYVQGLQADVKRAQEAKAKADAANKKAKEAEKITE